MPVGTPTSLLSAGSSSSATSYNTASVSPAGDVTLVLFVSAGITAVAAAPDSVTGLGLTWTKRTDEATNNGNLNGSIWTAKTGSSPGSGAITIGFASAPTNVGWKLVSITGCNPSGSNFADGTGSSTTTTLTMPSSPDSSSAIVSFINYNAGTANVMTPGSGYTKIGSDLDTPGNPANQVSASYDMTSPSSSVSWTTTNSSNKTTHAIELLEVTSSTGATSLLSSGSSTPSASYTTASVTPPADSLLLLWVASGLTAGAETPSSVSGLGLSWTKRADQDGPNTNTNGTLYTARSSSSPTSGAITINWATARDSVAWKLVALPGFSASSNVLATSSSTTGISGSLPSAPASSSAVLAFVSYNASGQTLTADGSLVKIGSDYQTTGSPTILASAAWDDPTSPSQSVSFTGSNLGNKILVAIAATAGVSNTEPVANTNGNQFVDALETVTLSGSASTDPDGSITAYNWTQVSGPTVTLSGSGANRTFVAPATVGGTSLTFSLVVTDNSSNTSAPALVTITVSAHSRFRIASDGTTRRPLIHSRK